MADLKARPGCCEEASVHSTNAYIPCNAPAVRLVGYKSGEGPYRMCAACADHNVRNRNGIDKGPYEAPTVTYSDADLVEKYVELRAKIKAEQETFDERIKPMKGALETIGNVLQATLVSRGADSTKTEHGTAYLSTTYRCTVSDPTAFRDFVIDTGNYDMFTNAVSKEAVEKYLEKVGALPPGVTRTGFTTCNVRKA